MLIPNVVVGLFIVSYLCSAYAEHLFFKGVGGLITEDGKVSISEDMESITLKASSIMFLISGIINKLSLVGGAGYLVSQLI